MIYWLIEYLPHKFEINKSPRWWNGTDWNLFKDGAWTTDANNAIQFVNDTQALVVQMALNNYKRAHQQDLGWHRSAFGAIKITEHQFGSAK